MNSEWLYQLCGERQEEETTLTMSDSKKHLDYMLGSSIGHLKPRTTHRKSLIVCLFFISSPPLCIQLHIFSFTINYYIPGRWKALRVIKIKRNMIYFLSPRNSQSQQ